MSPLTAANTHLGGDSIDRGVDPIHRIFLGLLLGVVMDLVDALYFRLLLAGFESLHVAFYGPPSVHERLFVLYI